MSIILGLIAYGYNWTNSYSVNPSLFVIAALKTFDGSTAGINALNFSIPFSITSIPWVIPLIPKIKIQSNIIFTNSTFYF